jgi:hypothetical protein
MKTGYSVYAGWLAMFMDAGWLPIFSKLYHCLYIGYAAWLTMLYMLYM